MRDCRFEGSGRQRVTNSQLALAWGYPKQSNNDDLCIRQTAGAFQEAQRRVKSLAQGTGIAPSVLEKRFSDMMEQVWSEFENGMIHYLSQQSE